MASSKKKTIYEIESPEYMLFNGKPSYIGQSISFVSATSKDDAKKIYEQKYSKPYYVKHYTGKKKVFMDLDKTKYKKRDDYKELFSD